MVIVLRHRRSSSAIRNPWLNFYSYYAALCRQKSIHLLRRDGSGRTQTNSVLRSAAQMWRRMDATKKRNYGRGGSEENAAKIALQKCLLLEKEQNATITSRNRPSNDNRMGYVFRSRTKRLNTVLNLMRSFLLVSGNNNAGGGDDLMEQRSEKLRNELDVWQREVIGQVMSEEI